MKIEPKKYTVRELVDAWESSQLRRNPEYQRGAAWTPPQKQALIDSLFRGYPIPPLFLQRKVRTGGLDGSESKSFEVVDGQQRLIALAGFLSDKYPLLEPKDKKLKLPGSLRTNPAPWGGRHFSKLDASLSKALQEKKVDVVEITEASDDEVRDLFIRLQSGTALSRQEIRDAWPGPIGPYIIQLAGKLDKKPLVKLFNMVDRRGASKADEEVKDYYRADRQTCAQALCVFLAREADPYVEQSIGPGDLDALYHERMDFDPSGGPAKRFEDCIRKTEEILEKVIEKGDRRKILKLDMFAVFMYVQDMSRTPEIKWSPKTIANIARAAVKFSKTTELPGKSTSGPRIRTYYEEWRKALGDAGVIRLDPKRTFDSDQKDEIRKRQLSKCAQCHRKVDREDEEFDHFPVPHRDGGRTVSSNGRLVHKQCHPRGKPDYAAELAEDDED